MFVRGVWRQERFQDQGEVDKAFFDLPSSLSVLAERPDLCEDIEHAGSGQM